MHLYAHSHTLTSYTDTHTLSDIHTHTHILTHAHSQTHKNASSPGILSCPDTFSAQWLALGPNVTWHTLLGPCHIRAALPHTDIHQALTHPAHPLPWEQYTPMQQMWGEGAHSTAAPDSHPHQKRCPQSRPHSYQPASLVYHLSHGSHGISPYFPSEGPVGRNVRLID